MYHGGTALRARGLRHAEAALRRLPLALRRAPAAQRPAEPSAAGGPSPGDGGGPARRGARHVAPLDCYLECLGAPALGALSHPLFLVRRVSLK